MNYQTTSNARRITLAWDKDDQCDVLVHTRCALENPESIKPLDGDYTVEDGATCAICGSDLLHYHGFTPPPDEA